MFNDSKKRCLKRQEELLQRAVDKSYCIRDISEKLILGYNHNHIRDIITQASTIECYWDFFEVELPDKLLELEQIITGKELYFDIDSLYDFIDGKTDYITFHIEKIQENGNVIDTGESYKKKFKVKRKEIKQCEIEVTSTSIPVWSEENITCINYLK